MNIGQFIAAWRDRLGDVPRASWLLRQLVALRLDIDEASVWAHPDRPLPEAVLTALQADAADLANGRPAAYVFGRTPFLSWTFKCDERALVPRPETEALAERIITRWQEQASHPPKAILDLCTGSGVLGLALGLHFPDAVITLTDLSDDALELAAENIALHNLGNRAVCSQGDLWAAVSEKTRFDLIVANPPYVASNDEVDASVAGHEPHLALYSGADGTEHITRILRELPEYLTSSGLAAFELGHRHRATQTEWLNGNLAEQVGHITWETDPFGVDRYLFCRPLLAGSLKNSGKDMVYG